MCGSHSCALLYQIAEDAKEFERARFQCTLSRALGVVVVLIMADSKWTTLQPVFSEAVSLLGTNPILFRDILDRLLSRRMLSLHRCEQLRQQYGKGAARQLLVSMMRMAPPSYDTFCQVLREVRGGSLLRLMSGASRRAANGERNRSISKRHCLSKKALLEMSCATLYINAVFVSRR